MAPEVQDDGQKSNEHNFEIWQHFCIQFFAKILYFDQQQPGPGLIYCQINQKWWIEPKWPIKI
jgi:hypothetical protein